MSSGSVTTWIELLKSGDQKAAGQLWDRYFQRLLELARRKIRDLPRRATDEEDVALSVFHAVYQAASKNRLPNLVNRDDLWMTLVVITAGKAVDARRREYRLKRGGRPLSASSEVASGHGPNEPERAEMTPADVLDDLLGHEPDPAFATMVEEEFQLLLRRLGDPALEQIAVCKLHGYTNLEIAEQLNCNERTVKRRLALIRKIWEADAESDASNYGLDAPDDKMPVKND